MYSTEKDKPNIFLSWQFLTVKLLALAAVAIWLEKPSGTMQGRIAFEETGFHNYTYNVGKNHVYAMAVGPRGDNEEERGVWIDSLGNYKIESLPVGEYQLKVRAPGFTTEYKTGIFIEEAQITKNLDVAMSMLQPTLTVATNKRVFTSKDKPSFWINTNGCGRVKVNVYRKDLLAVKNAPDALKRNGFELNQSLSFSASGYNNSKFLTNPFATEKPLQTFEKTLEQNYEDSANAHFQFNKPLPPGDYMMEAEGYPVMGNNKTTELSWFSVSDMGLIVMRAPEKTVVRAINLTTLKPVPGATISSSDYRYTTRTYPQVKTDANGFAVLKADKIANSTQLVDPDNNTDSTAEEALPKSQRLYSTLFITGRQGLNVAYDDLAYYAPLGQQYTTYIYTERPVYRLGQAVFFKGIIRKNTADGLKNDGASMNLKVTITDPESNELWHGTVKTSAHGSFHGMFNIPEDGHTGAYQIDVHLPDGNEEYCGFEIAQYKKPEYLVEVSPTKPRFVAGGKIEAKVHATYYFGGPVANARVKYTVYKSRDYSLQYKINPRPDYYGFFDSWEGSSFGSDYSGEFLTDGFAQTDANGEALVQFDTPKATVDPVEDPTTDDYADSNYKVEAEVTDISRLAVLGNASAVCTAGDFELFAESDTYVAKTGDPIKVTVRAVSYDGKPVANQSVRVLLNRQLLDQNYASRGYEHVADVTVVTDREGKAHTNITCKQWPSDTFYITAITKDSGDRTIVGGTSLWVANSSLPYMAGADEAAAKTVSIKMNKPIYRPGDTARFVISGPITGKEGAQAIFSIQGLKLYSYQVVNMDATAKVVEIPITKEYAPNVFAVVTLVDGNGKFYSQEEMVKVSPEDHFLNLQISTEKAKYHPGDKVQYTIKATHSDGSPAKSTEVSLGIVDESIYSIRPETAGSIQQAFYNRRDNSVLTSCSFPEEYSGGPDKDSVSSPKVRKNFKDLVAWLPELITDANGIVQTNVTLPDNLTTWRATARGVDMDTNVGATTQQIISTQDLILRLALPRFFYQGDEGLLTAVVHNYSDVEQKVKLTLTASPEFKTTVPLDQTLALSPEKAGRFSWPVSITHAGTGRLMVKAIGQTASDAMEQTVPILRFGIPAFTSSSGILTKDTDSVSIPAGVSSDGVREGAQYKLDLTSSTLGPVLGNFDKLIQYPYGCTEQTMSRMIPSIVAMQLHKQLNQPLSDQDIALFAKTNKKALEKLTGYHHDDGGWGWWATDNSNLDLTALVVNGMRLLKEAGYQPGPDFISTGTKYLSTNSAESFKQLSDPNVKDDWSKGQARLELAKTLCTLSYFKTKPTADELNYFKKRLRSSPPETLAYLCQACHNVGDGANAAVFYKRLIEVANTSPETTDWEHTLAMMRHFIDRKQVYDGMDYTYEYTGVETTAMALRCVLGMEPENVDRIESIKRWLMLHRDQNGWENTKTTAEVFLVLMQDELQARAKGASGNFSAHVALGSKDVADFVADASNLYASQKTYDIPMPAAPTKLQIDKTGTGRLYWNTLMTYFRTMQRGDTVANKGMPQGLKVTRKFFRIVPTATTSDGTTHFHSELIKDGNVRAGETILMRVLVESPMSLPYVCVEAPLPSGGEVLQGSDEQSSVADAEAQDTGKDDDSMQGDWSPPWWTHQDVLDDRIVYFGTELQAGKSTFDTLIRMELPGKLGVNPVNLTGMYTDKVRAYSELNEFTVKE